jgi:HD-GYP domain-containing protein (c-di-GMP phosphodiesterase class II)
VPVTAAASRTVRMAELVGVLARATDVGLGLPLEHAIRTCLLSVALGRRIGLDDADLSDLYYLALLRMLGCTSGSAEYADLFGDEVRFGRETQHLDYGDGAAFGAWVMTHFGSGRAPAERQAMIEHLFTYTPERRREALAGHCEVAQLFATRLDVSGAVVDGLEYVFERFDGNGAPYGIPGPDQPLIARIMVLCNEIEVHERLAGPDNAAHMARDRAGGAFDPDLVDAFFADRDGVLDVARGPALWNDLLAAEPGQPRHLHADQLVTAARVLGDFGDLKSVHLAGHSAEVARLAVSAAERAGLDAGTRSSLQLAALAHDLGRVAVSTSIWDWPGALSDSQWEAVRLHPYYSERCLAPARSLADVASLAGKHHERLNGSGYHRGDNRTALSPAARVLGAADAYAAMLSERPYRAALDPDKAGQELRRMAQEDLLDASAVNWVLASAGDTHPALRRRWPAGLTDREVDVLRAIAGGASIQATAAELHISAKTVDFHLQNVYAKAGVTTRAAATVFAIQHDLLIA